jgi:carboxyl-terminal processing protease
MERNRYKGKFEDMLPKIVAVLIIFLAGIWVGQNVALPFGSRTPIFNFTNTKAPSNVNVDFSPFWDVWKEISETHLDRSDIDPQKLLYGAISGMVKAVGDPYSVFLDPSQNEAFLDSLLGTYEGVGIELGARDGKLVIIAPIEGTPAEAAGVRAGDFIIGIDGRDATNITVPEAVGLIRGEAGDKVKLLLQRKGKDPFEVEITRKKITIKSLSLSEENSIPVIKLSRFGDSTNSEWDKAVNNILTKNYRKVILDLRNNPGGRLDQSVYIAGEFLPKGTVVLIQEDSKGEQVELTNDRDGRLQTIELLVLINEGSASASEIVAGALRDNKGTKLVGEKTFGKGTVQKVEDLPDGSGLHITIAKWLTPAGTWVNATGLSPDVKVEKTEEDYEKDLDPQLNRAIKLLD